MMVTKSKVAMMLVDEVMFDTQMKQKDDSNEAGAYDEKAVSHIAGRNIMGVVHYWRVHHGPNDEKGFTAFVDKSHFKKKVTMTDLVKILGDYRAAVSMFPILSKSHKEAFETKPISLRWDTTGWASVPSLKAIKSVKLNNKVIVEV
jgi:hypothetical protein